MKTLTLVRHAKSSWEYNVSDHKRPLKKRGVNDATLVSNKLKAEQLTFDKILSSDAERAKSTATIFLEHLNIPKSMISLNHDLYDFSGIDLVKVIKSCEKDIDNLLVFGHNHAITSFVNTYGNKYFDNIPTSGTTIIEFDINNWQDLKPGKTLKTIFPRDLK